jgi:hypothetical protein
VINVVHLPFCFSFYGEMQVQHNYRKKGTPKFVARQKIEKGGRRKMVPLRSRARGYLFDSSVEVETSLQNRLGSQNVRLHHARAG